MTTLQITFVSEDAGYQNSFGWYNSRTGEAGIIFINTNDDGPKAGISAGTTATVDVAQSDIDAGYIGFFVIPNGADIYGAGKKSVLNGPLHFDTKPNGDGEILDARGHKLSGEQGEIIFTDPTLNKHNTDYTSDHAGRGQSRADLAADNADGITGRIAFEDLVRGSDRDYNDLVVDVQIVNANRPPVVEDQAFQIAENSAADTVVGRVAASDPDAGQTLSYAIIAGNEGGAFAINAATGAITVADASKLDFENPDLDSYDLTVKVTDSGSGALTDTAIVRIAVTDALPIVGTPGNDNLIGTAGDDVLIAGLGNDLLRGGADNDVLNGGVVADFQSDVGFRDTDRADYSTASSGVNVNLATGTAQDGEGGTDTLIGIEAVNGSAFDDVLTGGTEAFVEFFRGGAGNDTIDGASWSDRAEYMDATAGIAVNLAALAPNKGTVTGNASVGTDTLINVEIVYGSDFADTYNATGFLSASQPGGLVSNFNSFEGRAGNDTIVGNGATRLEFTGASGGIMANLATGIATGDASVGTDTFSGVNSIRATQFADTLLGGNPLLNGFEGFEGRAGDDYIDGGQGFDLAVYAFDGPITTGIAVNLAAGTVAGDPVLTGIDTLRGIEGVQGSHLNDSYDATGFSAASVNAGSLGPSGTYNEFQGMAGDDTILGNGNTRIIYTAAREGVSVDLAAGTAVGGTSVGTDTILGGVFAVRGSNFGDVLIGSAANEYFEGRAGNDAIDGGDGFDTAAYDVGASSGGSFVANASGGISATAAGLGTDALTNIESIVGTNFGDLFDGSAASIGYSVDGRSGNDTLIGSQGGDFLNGGSDDDTLSGGAGDDFVDGGAGNDVVDGGDGFDQAHYEFGATSSGSFVANSLGVITASAGGTGSDTLTNVEWISGTAFGDLFDGSAATLGYSFDGYVGDDTLIGSQGNDQLRGSDGNDVLVGSGGGDQMDGGSGLDRADYSGAFGAVNVDLSSSTATDGMGGLDTLINIEAVSGSAFNDTLIGDWLDNRLEGGLGDDLLRGGQGSDYIDGGPGSDRIDFDAPWDGMDTVAGFEAVPGGDVIDIVDLLQNWTSFGGGSGGPLSSFVRLETIGPDAQLQIDSDGFGPMFWQPLATLLGRAGLTLETLVANGNLDSGAVSGVTLIGTPGNDFLDGTPGNDTILADLGNDFLRGRAGNDLLNGGVVADLQSDVGWQDSDRVDYSSAFSGVNVNLGTGIAQDGEGGTDTLIGIESVTGSFYNDLLTGSGAFFESFLGSAGDDMINGAGGLDSADYSNASSGVSISLGGFGGFSTSTGSVSGDASVGFDTLLDVEQFIGSNSADTLNVGSFLSASQPGGFLSNFNAIQGRGGDDSITGNGGTRIEYSGATSAVNVNLNTGIATGDASVGTDTFSGVNQVRGSSFADTLLGGNPLYNSLESFDGRGGNDSIDGGQGWDRADYAFNGLVTTGIMANLAAGTVTGDPVLAGSDTLHGIEAIRGSHLADSFNAIGFSDSSTNAGSSGTLNEFEGMAGNDTIIGNGNTRVSYSFAREAVSVDLQAGTAVGGASVGSDTFSGVNAVRGSNFNDTLTGSASNDILEGLSGNDLLRGGQGADFINGGLGSDTIDFNSLADAGDTISGFEAVPGGDVLDIADLLASSTSFAGGAGGPLANFVRLQAQGPDGLLQIDPDGSGFQSWQTLATLVGGSGINLDTLLAQGNLEVGPVGGGGVTLIGTPGNDTLIGTPGNDTILADLGNDFLRGGGGNDLLNGGVVADLQSDIGFKDTDRADYSTATAGVNVNLATGVASDGEGGTDTLIGIEAVNGSASGDVLTGSNAFQEFFQGGGGDDTILGGGGFDRAEYVSATAGVSFVLGAVSGTSTSAATASSLDLSTGFDTLLDVEQFTGSSFDDSYVVHAFASGTSPGGLLSSFNSFEGRGGNDSITGNGNTRIEYASASSAVSVNLATGSATGDPFSVGTDSFTGVNSVRGGSFADSLVGGNALNNSLETFDGRGGNDFIDGGQGWDRADYAFNGPVPFGINVALAAGTVTGDSQFVGTDTLRSVEAVRGTHLADTYNATGFSEFSTNAGSSGTLNEFEGMAGNDTIFGNGNTRVSYSFAREAVSVDLQAGTATGGASVGSDTFSGVNAVRGSNFDDVLTGSTSNDFFDGLSGNDLLRGGGGADFLIGGPGSDTYDFDGLLDAGDTVSGFTAGTGGDVLDIADLLASSTSYAGGAGGPLAGFVRVEAAGPDGLLQIDPDGFAGIQGWQTLATLLGGAGLNLDMLVNGGNLDTETDVGGITLIGTPGNDTLIGGPGNDTILADLGNDFLHGGGGNDLLNGGVVADLQSDVGWRDSDRVDYSSAFTGVNVNLGTGIAQDGEGGTDTLIGIEAVNGSTFDDVLAGSNAFQENFQGGAGNDTINGAGGLDRAEYNNATSAVSISLGGFGGFSTSTGSVNGNASVGLDTLLDVEQFTGSNFADTFSVGSFLSGSQPGGFLSNFNSFEGRVGDDIISGNGGTRIEYSGATGAVNVNLATGVATGDASVGTDTFTGVNQVRGSSFADTLLGGNPFTNGLEVFDGRGGNDFIDGGQGFDRADYAFNGAVTTGITVNLAAGTVTGDPALTGSDTLRGIEAIRGSHQNDFYDATGFSGSSTNAGSSGTFNEFEGGAGNDMITGNGNTRVSYSFAREAVSVDLQAGTAVGGASVGSDNFSGVNAVRGSNFDDVLTGSASNDILEGLNGNDLLRGGAGADTIDGGFGNDRADYSSSFGGVNVNLISGTASDGMGGSDTLLNIEEVAGSGVNDTLIGNSANNILEGNLGSDFLRGGGGNDLLNGGVVADLQSDVGWRDSDRVDYSSAFTGVNVNLGTGIAQDGEGGTDTLIGIESVNGSAFNDLLTGSNAFQENFQGGAGNDTILGAGGNDRAEYNNATLGVSITLGGSPGLSNSTGTVSGDASVGFDTLLDVEQFTGSNFADTFSVGSFLSGSSPGGFLSNFNSFEGRAGDDIISGNGATRIEYSGATSAVYVNLNTGIATAIVPGDTSVGTDSISGVNQVRGSSFADTLLGANPLYNGLESFDGRGGNDWIDGDIGWDRADYAFNGAVTTGITVNLAAGTVTGDPALTGSDTLRGIEAIRGSHQNDFYDATGFSGSSTNTGSSGTLNEFEGMAGNDNVIGNGNTRISYASAREAVSVDLQAGTATGGASVGSDNFSGVNAVLGSNFDDVLIGSASNDNLNGLSGNDLLRGGQGADFINGGAGSDRIDFDSLLDAGDTISGFEAVTGGDVLDIADLLQNWTSYAGGAGGPLADFVRVEVAGPDGHLQIDTDGSTGGGNWQTLATLLGGSALDVDTLLTQGNLDILI